MKSFALAETMLSIRVLLPGHLTTNAVELSIVLEEAIMNGYDRVGDFMVRNTVCAYLWQPLSFIRQTMLANSFSYLPVPTGDRGSQFGNWLQISDLPVICETRVDFLENG